jgi:hypothetical protein
VGVVVSGAVGFGLFCVVIVLVFLAVSALFWRRDNPGVRRARALRWAKEADLALPPELVDPLAARLRRRTLDGMLLAVLIMVPAAGLLGWTLASGFGVVEAGNAPLHGPAVVLAMLTPVVLLNVLQEARDLTRQRRAEPLTGLRPTQIGLRDAVPVWLLWSARAVTVAVPVVAALLLADLRRHGYAAGSTPLFLAFGMLLFVGLVSLRGVESRQLAALNGRQPEGGRQVQAFDDSFRVPAVLNLVPLVPNLLYLAGSLLLQSVYSQVVPQHRLAAHVFEDLWLPVGLAVFLLTVAPQQPRVRRYYRGRRHRPPAAEPPTTETASC